MNLARRFLKKESQVKTLSRLAIAFLVACAGLAQEEELPTFTVGYDFTSAPTFSVQSPASNTMRGLLSAVYIRSTVACTIDQYLGGSVAGGTAVTPQGTNTTATSTLTIKQGGTHSGGAKLEPTIDLVAGVGQTLLLDDVSFARGLAAIQSYVLKSTTCTGTTRIALKYRERSR